MPRTTHNDEELFAVNQPKQSVVLGQKLSDLLDSYKHAPRLPWTFTEDVDEETQVLLGNSYTKFITSVDENGDESVVGMLTVFEDGASASDTTKAATLDYIEKAVNTAAVAAILQADTILVVEHLLSLNSKIGEMALQSADQTVEAMKNFSGLVLSNTELKKLNKIREELKAGLQDIERIKELLADDFSRSAFLEVWFERNKLFEATVKYRQLVMELQAYCIRRGPKETTYNTKEIDEVIRKFHESVIYPTQHLPSWLDYVGVHAQKEK